MLDKIIAARAVGLGVGDEAAHRIKLVVTRENHRLLTDHPYAFVSGDFLFLNFQMHEALQDIQQAVGGQRLVPQVVRLPVVLHGWITGTVLVAFVEGQKESFLALQPRCHPCLIGVNGEMHQRSLLEGE